MKRMFKKLKIKIKNRAVSFSGLMARVQEGIICLLLCRMMFARDFGPKQILWGIESLNQFICKLTNDASFHLWFILHSSLCFFFYLACEIYYCNPHFSNELQGTYKICYFIWFTYKQYLVFSETMCWALPDFLILYLVVFHSLRCFLLFVYLDQTIEIQRVGQHPKVIYDEPSQGIRSLQVKYQCSSMFLIRASWPGTAKQTNHKKCLAVRQY